MSKKVYISTLLGVAVGVAIAFSVVEYKAMKAKEEFERQQAENMVQMKQAQVDAANAFREAEKEADRIANKYIQEAEQKQAELASSLAKDQKAYVEKLKQREADHAQFEKNLAKLEPKVVNVSIGVPLVCGQNVDCRNPREVAYKLSGKLEQIKAKARESKEYEGLSGGCEVAYDNFKDSQIPPLPGPNGPNDFVQRFLNMCNSLSIVRVGK